MKRKKFISIILSIIFSLFMIIGNSFKKSGSFDLIVKFPLKNLFFFLLLVFLFHKIIYYLFGKIDTFSFQEKKSKSRLVILFEKHPFLFCLIIMLICWLPYIIAFYPAILSPDPSYQIMQYFGIDNKYSTYAILLDENVIITNHHPVVHTLLLGSMVKIGTIIGNVNIGLFLYSLIQIIILASTLSYTIKFMKSLNVSNCYCFICLAIYGLVPVFPFYSMSAVKDVIFGCLIILYIISIYKLTTSKEIKKMMIVKQIILMILMILFRNNGIHVILLSFPFLFFLGKKNLKKYLLIFLIVISFNVTYNKIILPYFKITPSSIREMLSIPFQQTARYTRDYSDEISEEEKQIIDKLLDYDTLATRYKPEISDPVKNKFNPYYTNEDLKNYFSVWFGGLTKHPFTYIEATIENTYGYFYPLKTNWYFYHNYDTRIVKKGFDYHYNGLSVIREILTLLGKKFPYIPVLGLIVNIGFNSWLLLFIAGYLLYKKKYKELIVLLPSFVLLLVCVASPVNTYFRYALPNIFGMPLLIGIFLSLSKN